MNDMNSRWNIFAKSGSVYDYINYKNSLSQEVVKNQGEVKNAHKDGRSCNQRTEYR